jgi:hypothetical protein
MIFSGDMVSTQDIDHQWLGRRKNGSSGKFVLFIASAGMTWRHGRDIIA